MSAEVAYKKVFGWPEKTTEAEQRDWIDDFSDHALLYGQVIE